MRARKAQAKKPQAKAVAMRPATRARVSRPMITMDRAAVEWAQLMKDPCNARLTFPCYPSSSGGTVLIRFEADAILASGATETALTLVYVPGAFSMFNNVTALTSDNLGTVLQNVPASLPFPGYSYLNNNANAFRCVAACAQVSYPGTELNRSGILGMGVADSAVLATNMQTADGGGNININAGQLRTLCQHVERMPASVTEVRWFPGEDDAKVYSPGSNHLSRANECEGRNAIIISASGFPGSTGVRVRCVAIYEVSLGAGQGQVASISPPASNNTPNQVVKALYDSDPKWYIEFAGKAGRAVSSVISYAASGAKALQTFSTAAGLLL